MLITLESYEIFKKIQQTEIKWENKNKKLLSLEKLFYFDLVYYDFIHEGKLDFIDVITLFQWK